MQLRIELPHRISDCYGMGHFGASRGTGKKHNGVDFESPPGFKLCSPVAGEVTKIGFPYSDDLSFQYVQIKCRRGLFHRFFYIIPAVKPRQLVAMNDCLGRVDDLRRRYPKDKNHHQPITNHIHYEILDEKGNYLNPDDY